MGCHNHKKQDPSDSHKKRDPVDSHKKRDPVDSHKKRDPSDCHKKRGPVEDTLIEFANSLFSSNSKVDLDTRTQFGFDGQKNRSKEIHLLEEIFEIKKQMLENQINHLEMLMKQQSEHYEALICDLKLSNQTLREIIADNLQKNQPKA